MPWSQVRTVPGRVPHVDPMRHMGTARSTPRNTQLGVSTRRRRRRIRAGCLPGRSATGRDAPPLVLVEPPRPPCAVDAGLYLGVFVPVEAHAGTVWRSGMQNGGRLSCARHPATATRCMCNRWPWPAPGVALLEVTMSELPYLIRKVRGGWSSSDLSTHRSGSDGGGLGTVRVHTQRVDHGRVPPDANRCDEPTDRRVVVGAIPLGLAGLQHPLSWTRLRWDLTAAA